MKFALRALFNTPFVTAIAILSLALGVGANAAIFSLFNQMLLRPLPVPRAEDLVNLSAPGPKPGSQSCGQAGNCDTVFSYAMFRDLERVQKVFTSIAAHRQFGANLAYNGQTISGAGMLVSGSYFPVLQLQPFIGRLITPADDRAVDESPVVVLSYAYWQSRFGSDPSVLNQTMVVNGHKMTIVGVAPSGFRGTTLGIDTQVFVPITMRGYMQPGFRAWTNRTDYWVYLFARLRHDVSLEQARASLGTQYHGIINDVEAPLQKDMSAGTMARFKAKTIGIERDPRGQSVVTTTATPLYLLFGVTALVLVIACANIANLLLARGAARASEMGVRLSIGAGRWQLVGHLLTESLILAAFGGIAGVAVAKWTLDLIDSLLPAEMSRFFNFGLEPRMVAFAAILSMGTGILVGLFPALHSTRLDLLSTLKGQSGQAFGARSAARLRVSLVTAQIALSMMLLATAGLFTKSLLNVSRIDLGVHAENVISFSLSPQLNGYKPDACRALYERLEADLAALPGVSSATTAVIALLAGTEWGTNVTIEGFPAGPDTDTNSSVNEVGPDYFRTLGVPILAGRTFTASDAVGGPKVAIVNEAFAKKFNLGRDAVGKHFSDSTGKDSKLDIEIIGLAQNAKYSNVKREIPPVYFRPYRQDQRLRGITFYVRTVLDPSQLYATIRQLVAKADPSLPVDNLRTLLEQAQGNLSIDKVLSILSAAFAALATVLAAIGLYGVLAYTVAQRTREIGLRIALGAAPARVRAMIMRQVGWMTIVGGTIGLGLAIWLGKGAASLLYQLRSWDPPVLVLSAIVLSIVALVAGFIPAHRASRVDPMQALRYE